jgi:predicted transcriptional regulator
MSRRTKLPTGELEQTTLVALCELGHATAREVHSAMASGLAYTTIATVLDRLFAKDLVVRALEGRAFVYRPKVRRGAIEKARMRDLVGLILGSNPEPVIANLVDAVESIDEKLLDALAREVNARKRSRRGSS